MLLYLCNTVDILWITLPGCDNMSRGKMSQAAGLPPARKLRRVYNCVTMSQATPVAR